MRTKDECGENTEAKELCNKSLPEWGKSSPGVQKTLEIGTHFGMSKTVLAVL